MCSPTQLNQLSFTFNRSDQFGIESLAYEAVTRASNVAHFYRLAAGIHGHGSLSSAISLVS